MTVTLNMTNAAANASNIGVNVRGGGFALSAGSPLAVNGSFSFSGLSITQHALAFTVASGTSFQGTIALPVKKDGGSDPSITVNNLSADTVTLTWPTEDGPVTQELTPGTPMALSGFVDG